MRAWIDFARLAELPRQPEADDQYAATVIVDQDGTDHLVLLSRTTYERDDRENRTGWVDWPCAGIAHEQLGPLPARWAQRTVLAPARCGRPTASGVRCRMYVSAPGQPCRHHRPKTGIETW
jgi:hypothetical protein